MAGCGTARAALSVIEAADAARFVEELPALVLPALARAFGANSLGWTWCEVPVTSTEERYRAFPCPLFDRETSLAFERHLVDFPLGVHTRPGGPGNPVRRSDLQSGHHYRTGRLYREVLRPLGIEEILATALRGPKVHVCLSLHRDSSDFSPSSVDLLTQLRPLLERRLVLLAGRAARVAPAVLTPRQREVLTLVGRGLTDSAIGRQLGCSPRTVDKHLEHAYRRLGVRGRAEAVAVWLTPADVTATSPR
ncbi:MAG TPA: LuxR C-terminal-related transcriptional regulator [Pseudonocardia sp.]|nr:LuxR C-terminal-related transcriptional regulator [Pseudonocardia sp.]